MRAPVFHLRDACIGVVRMAPVGVTALLRALPIHAREIGPRERLDARRLGQPRQKLLICLTRVAAHDAPQRRVGLKRCGIDPDRLSLDEIGRREHLQDPGKDCPVRLQIDQAPRPRNRRVLGWGLRPGPAPGSPAAPANPRCARQSRAPNRSPRSTQSTAAGSRSPAADLDGRLSRRRTGRIAPRQTRRTRACPGPDSTADRTERVALRGGTILEYPTDRLVPPPIKTYKSFIYSVYLNTSCPIPLYIPHFLTVTAASESGTLALVASRYANDSRHSA